MENTKRDAGIITCKLIGLHSHEKVLTLNEKTSIRRGEKKFKRYYAFGYCTELGNIAFIGLTNSIDCQNYGSIEINGTSTIQFKLYTCEEAKNVTDYTIFLLEGEQLFAETSVKKLEKPFHLKFFRK